MKRYDVAVERVTFRHGVLEADAKATREAYARADRGGAEECGCDDRRNFAASRDRIYPEEVLRLARSWASTPARKEGPTDAPDPGGNT